MKTLVQYCNEALLDTDDEVKSDLIEKNQIRAICNLFVDTLGIGPKIPESELEKAIKYGSLPVFVDCENPKHITDPIEFVKTQSNKLVHLVKNKLNTNCRFVVQYDPTCGLVTFSYSFHYNRKFILSFGLRVDSKSDYTNFELRCVPHDPRLRTFTYHYLYDYTERSN